MHKPQEGKCCHHKRSLSIANHKPCDEEHIWGQILYLLGGFFGYNKIFIYPKDQHKVSFSSKQKPFAYGAMPFGLKNALTPHVSHVLEIFEKFSRNVCR